MRALWRLSIAASTLMASLDGAGNALLGSQARLPVASAALASTARPASECTISPIIALPPLTTTERAWVVDPSRIPSPVRLGFGRAFPDAGFTAALSDPDHWRPTADGGRQLRLAITSPGALGLRLGLAVDALPEGTQLRLHSAQTADLEPISGAEITASLARDRAASAATGESPDAAPVFWSPLVLGETLTLELSLPSGVDPTALALRPVRVSHLFRLPFTPVGERTQDDFGRFDRAVREGFGRWLGQ